MSPTNQQDAKSDLIDVASAASSEKVRFDDHLRAGKVALARCTLQPNHGAFVGWAQVTTAIYDGASFRMDWRSPESDRVQSSLVADGRAILADAGLPMWKRWQARPSLFAFAIDEAFVKQIWQQAFDAAGHPSIQTSMGVDDPVIERFVGLGKRELSESGAGGRLYVEALAAALSIHLLRKYGTSRQSPCQHKGGLPPALLRRVIEYINAHLCNELGLVELAGIAKLSPHHFGAAFKAAMGTSPHQYIIERRVDRAREFLHDPDRPIAEIAQAVGFSSQSHLTTHFRRLTGVTPARFRRPVD